jgi:hypothetical protein
MAQTGRLVRHVPGAATATATATATANFAQFTAARMIGAFFILDFHPPPGDPP